MSTTPRSDTVEGCRPIERTPVAVEATTIADVSRDDLRTLAAELAREGYVPAEVTAEVRFEEDCSLATQEEADRLRDLVRAGAFLGVGVVRVEIEDLRNPEKVRPALSALEERARRKASPFRSTASTFRPEWASGR
jgi:regulator of protease activity HflC (stomatin/prohibitin superfamily)